MPKGFVFKHKYASAHSLDAGIGTMAIQVFKYNDMFDPDETGGATGQPRGYDQMSAFYQYYRVLRVRGSVTFCNDTNTDTAICFVGNSHSSTVATLTSTPYESSNYQKRLLPKNSNESRTIRIRFTPARWIGSRIEKAHISGPVGGSPDEIMYLHVGYFAMDNTVNPGIMHVLVSLWFETLWYNKNSLPASS